MHDLAPTVPSFASLGVTPALLEALAKQGIAEPFPIQALAIGEALAGHDLCGKARTGAGKTLAFGIPLVQRAEHARPKRPTALVLVPTRELAEQTAEVLAPLARAAGHRVLSVFGGASMRRQTEALRRGVEIVVATPGRLIDLAQQRALFLDHVRAVVLDEADRMADMGFLRPVEWILEQTGEQRQTMLFSATLDGDVARIVRDHLRNPQEIEAPDDAASLDAMTHRFVVIEPTEKVATTVELVAGGARTIVFVRTKRGADNLVRRLEQHGVDAAAIHGDLRQAARQRALARFAAPRPPVLVATDVASRGIHVDGIDVVVHFDPPEDHKAYVHRSGRTARAGQAGTVVSLLAPNQLREAKRLQRELTLDVSIDRPGSSAEHRPQTAAEHDETLLGHAAPELATPEPAAPVSQPLSVVRPGAVGAVLSARRSTLEAIA